MTDSQRIQLARLEKQKEIRSLYAAETRDETAIVAAEAEMGRMETEHAAAIRAEAAAAGEAFLGHVELSAEHRERVSITERADLGVMMGNAISRRNQTGAEAEAQQAWNLDGDQVPMSMIAEVRTVAAPASGGGTQAVAGYVFGASIATFAGIARPMVPAGTPVFPSVSVAAVAGRPAEGAAHASTEPTIRGQLLEPHRIQAVASISVEDRGRFPSLGQALAAHLAESVAFGMDTQALIDDNGFFDSSSGPLTEPNAPGAATSYAQALAMLTAGVDGARAANLANAGLLIGQETFADFMALAGTNSDESVMERMMRVGRIMVSNRVPAAASNVQNALTVRGMAPAAIQPVWPGLRIEDIYSSSGTGEISFTAVGLAAFSVQAPSAYAWQKSNVS